jgi:hypothetical protein
MSLLLSLRFDAQARVSTQVSLRKDLYMALLVTLLSLFLLSAVFTLACV